jgi:hypothetical protein
MKQGPAPVRRTETTRSSHLRRSCTWRWKTSTGPPQKTEARPQWTVPPVSWWQRADTIPAAVEGPAPYCIAIQRWIGAGLLCSRPLCHQDTQPDGGSVPQNALYYKASTDHWGPRNGPKSCGPAVVNVIIRKLPDTFTMWKHRRYSWFDLYFKIVDLDQVSSSVR